MLGDIAVFTIAGKVQGKGRPRVFKGRGVTPRTTREWTDRAVKIIQETWPRGPLDHAVRVDVLAIKQRPGNLQRKKDQYGLIWRTTKPDRDNVDKICLDSLVKAGVLRDDTLVVAGQVLNLYSEKEGNPRTVIILSSVNDLSEYLSDYGHLELF